MRRLIRVFLVLAAILAIMTAVEWTRERSIRATVDLRDFDAAAVGKLDTDMWRSYYERRPLLLFRQMITLLRAQYRMPVLRATLNAYRAAHAAFVFRDGRNRADYAKALPDLELYFADIASLAVQTFDSREAARLELEWWILHRERSTKLDAALAEVQGVVYRTPASAFTEHAQLRATAMILRDLKGNVITEDDWRRIGAMLNRSWLSLYAAVNGKVLAENRRQTAPGSFGTR